MSASRSAARPASSGAETFSVSRENSSLVRPISKLRHLERAAALDDGVEDPTSGAASRSGGLRRPQWRRGGRRVSRRDAIIGCGASWNLRQSGIVAAACLFTGDHESRRLGGILAQKGSVLFRFHAESLLTSWTPVRRHAAGVPSFQGRSAINWTSDRMDPADRLQQLRREDPPARGALLRAQRAGDLRRGVRSRCCTSSRGSKRIIPISSRSTRRLNASPDG